jgi:hypothetical protein
MTVSLGRLYNLHAVCQFSKGSTLFSVVIENKRDVVTEDQ